MARHNNRIWLATLALFVALGLTISCSGIEKEDGPNLIVEEKKIEEGKVIVDFDIVPPGWQPADSTITIKNNGSRDLVISQFEWEGPVNPSIFFCADQTQPINCVSRQLPFKLAPDTSLQIKMFYGPKTAEDLKNIADTVLLIGSNDADFPVMRLVFRVPQSFPQIAVDRTNLSFPGATPNNPKKETVTVSNVGTRDLFIKDFKIQASGDSGNKFAILTSTADTTCQKQLTLKSGASCTLSVEYTPTGGAPDSGTLVIETNDPNNSTLGISLGSSVSEPRIQVSTEDGTPHITLLTPGQSRKFTVTNVGVGALTINGLRIRPDTAASNFSLAGFTNKFALKQGESHEFSVTLNTAVAGATIEIDSSDTTQSPYVIQLFTGQPQADLRVVPAGSLTFFVKNGGTQTRTLLIENRGDAIGNLQSAFISNSQGGRFAPDQLSSTTGIPAGGVLAMPITFTASQIDPGALFPITLTGEVTLNMGGFETKVVLYAIVDADDSKKPIAKLLPQGSSFTVCDQITFDGSGSSATDGQLLVTGFEWKLTGKPANSRSFLSHTSKSLAYLQPDQPGTYTVILSVLDANNRTSDEVKVDINVTAASCN